MVRRILPWEEQRNRVPVKETEMQGLEAGANLATSRTRGEDAEAAARGWVGDVIREGGGQEHIGV